MVRCSFFTGAVTNDCFVSQIAFSMDMYLIHFFCWRFKTNILTRGHQVFVDNPSNKSTRQEKKPGWMKFIEKSTWLAFSPKYSIHET